MGIVGFATERLCLLQRTILITVLNLCQIVPNFGKDLLKKLQIQGLEQSPIVLIENDNIYTRSSDLRKALLKVPKYRTARFLLFLFPKKVLKNNIAK